MVYSGSRIPISKQLYIVMICDAIKIPYQQGGLVDQPKWWVEVYQSYLTGKHKAEDALAKKK